MNMDKKIKDGIIVLDEPLDFGEGDVIYGILFNKEFEKHNEETGNPISEYVEYIAGMAQVCKYGVPLKDETGWKFPKSKITVNCDLNTLARFVGIFYKDKVDFKKYTFDEPVICQTDEVDEDNQSIIIKKSLIERYIQNN